MTDENEILKVLDDMNNIPPDQQPYSFDELAAPVRQAILDAYDMVRKPETDITWTGPNIGRDELATCVPPSVRLTADWLSKSLEDQGRDALDEILCIAIQLGIEQGRRIVRTGLEYKTLKLEAAIGKYKARDQAQNDPPSL